MKPKCLDVRGASALRPLAPALFILSGGLAFAQNDVFRASVDLDLVVLQANVQDRKGHAVDGLTRDDFAVYEDGALQSIRLFRHDDAPVTIGLVVDHSGSMREKIKTVTSAARAFVDSSNPRDQMFVVNFNERVSLGLPAKVAFSNQPAALAGAIGNSPAEGMTALYDAIGEGLITLRKGEHDKKALLVISDGGDNASQSKLDQVLDAAHKANVVIYAVGVFDPEDPDKNPGVLRRLAHETGGEAYFPSQLGETVEICKRIARDIRDQYTLGYVSANVTRGVYHQIRVVARPKAPGKITVRTRAGYIRGEAL